MAELAGVLVGNYFLLECVAREGMVETYRARPTTRGGYDVILRLFRPAFPDPTAFREHFATEVEKVWRCAHEHIQPLLEFGTGDELLYCATLLTEGVTLAEYLTQQPEQYLSIPIVMQLVTQLCSALQYAHQHNIVHGNIQPSSILLCDNQVLLTHFSMKRVYRDGDPLAAHLEEGNAAYIAPEQSLGMIRPTSDIYAVGVLLYRLLGGMLPYDGEEPGVVALKHTNEPIPSLRLLRPEIPEELELVVQMALAKSPEARFPSAAALAQALHAALLPDAPQVISIMPEPRIMVKARRTHLTWSRVASFLTLSVLLFGLLGTSFFIFSLPRPIYDMRSQPIWTIMQSSIMHTTPASTPTIKRIGLTATPTTVAVTPVGKSHPPIRSTTTVGVSPTPGRGTGSITPTPLSTAPPSFVCTSGTLSIEGSPDAEPLLQQVANDYTQQCTNLSVTLSSSGIRVALNALQRGSIDAASSDLTALPQRNLTDQPIAALLYAVIVSPDVQINGLSSSELQDIYQGRITNWAQVGGPDEPITVVLHPNDTVTTIFRAFVLNGQPISIKGPKLKREWAQTVAQASGAISYVPLIEAQNAHVPVLAIDGSLPTISSVVQGTYPFWSVEHLYTQGNGSSSFQAYLACLSSIQEAGVFAHYGAISISQLPQSVLASHLPGPEI
jgi:serine/threonine protein kinase